MVIFVKTSKLPDCLENLHVDDQLYVKQNL